MESKKKKIMILISILVIVVIAIVVCILLFHKPNNSNQNNKNNPSNNPNGSSENNKPNDNENNNSSDNETPGNNSGDNNSNNDNSNENPNGSGNNSSNSTPTTTPKKLRIYSCRRTTTENGVEIVDSLSLRYHIENGLQSDEVIATLKVLNSDGNSMLEAYKNWMTQLKTLKGVSVTTTQSGDKTVFNIKTDYTKVDYSNINFEDENRIQFYNDIRANDTIEIITEFLNEAGYTCQPPKEA